MRASDWHAHIYDEVPVPPEGTRKEKVAAMTQQMAGLFESGIREHPEDWHMLQKVFVADLDPDRLGGGGQGRPVEGRQRGKRRRCGEHCHAAAPTAPGRGPRRQRSRQQESADP